MDVITHADPAVWEAIQGERRRQQQGIEMISSENYTSPPVLAAHGPVMPNHYAEAYPGPRYHGLCVFVEVVERPALPRLPQLFTAVV